MDGQIKDVTDPKMNSKKTLSPTTNKLPKNAAIRRNKGRDLLYANTPWMFPIGEKGCSIGTRGQEIYYIDQNILKGCKTS